MPDQKEDGGLAFPSDYMIREFAETKTLTDEQKEKQILFVSGICVRDYFAAKAMQMFSGIDITTERSTHVELEFTNAARQAYAYADAMLQARKK